MVMARLAPVRNLPARRCSNDAADRPAVSAASVGGYRRFGAAARRIRPGVHPGFADERAHHGHDHDLNVGPRPMSREARRFSPTTKIGNAR
jgi:hypothetical protein